ncbi:MAG TPA: GNAT family N-acetyltransferase [Ruania sp.]|nr:GNAT family N-acetyltransferase [Ruania sp.]
MSIEVVRAEALGDRGRRAAAALLARGFAEDFAAITSDRDRLAAAFEPIILPEHIYLALRDGQPAGIATLTGADQEVFVPRWAPLRHRLGVLRGTVLHVVVRIWFMGGDPDGVPGQAEIGSVATDPEHRGHGVATALIRHLLEVSDHRVHVLRDIKDTNEAALRVYRRLGFVEYTRRKARFSRRAGFSAYVSMRREGTGSSQTEAGAGPDRSAHEG